MANQRFQKTFVFDPSSQLVTTTTAKSSDLTSGKVGIFGPDQLGVGATPTPTTKKFIKIHQNVGDNKYGTVRTQPIQGEKVLRFFAKKAQDAQAQISYVGYDGSSTSTDIPALSAGEVVKVSIGIFSNKVRRWYGNIGLRHTVVVSAPFAAKSKLEVAQEIADVINDVNSRPGDYPTNFELVNFLSADVVGTGTLAEFDADVTVTKDSKIVTFAGNDTTYGAGTTALVAGDFVSLRGSIYEVDTVDSGTVTLTRAYKGATETIAVASTTNAAAHFTAATNYGVKITGLVPDPQEYSAIDPIAPKDIEIVTFEIAANYGAVAQLDDINFTDLSDALDVTVSQKAKTGCGFANEVRLLEAESQGFDRLHTIGHMFDQRHQKPGYIFNSADGTKYDVYTLQYDYSHDVGQAGASPRTITEPYEVNFCVPTGTGAALESVLNSYLSPLGFTAIDIADGSSVEGDLSEAEN